MKKLLLTIGLAAVGVSAFAQGNFIFGSSGSYVWNTNSTRAAAGTVTTAFLFSSVNTGPSVAGVMTSTPTNTSATQITSAQNTTAWTDLLTDPNFHFATNSGSGLVVAGTTTAAGGISYNGGVAFTAANSSSGGGTAYIMAVAWAGGYADPFAAAAAGAAVGWSPVFAYSYVAGPVPGPTGTATSMGSQQTGWQFGVLGVTSVPEPSTMALAALGGASLLLFRRRSSK